MKILHINGSKTWGGNEQQLVDLIHTLEKQKISSIVFGIKNKPLHRYCDKKNLKFINAFDIKINFKKNFKFLHIIISKYKPDIIHLHTSDAVTLYYLSDILYKLNTPAVFSKKGVGKSMSILSKYKYNFKNVKHIICVSSTVKDFMSEKVIFRKNTKKLSIIYDYINTERIDVVNRKNTLKKTYNIDENISIIGNIANHFDAKDIKTLIKSLNYLVNVLNEKNIKLVQIGKKTDKTEEFKNLIKKYNLEKYVIFTDFVEDASNYLKEFDIFTISSQREGGPSSVLEAFYCKVPVVSTKVGILPEIIKDGKNGYLVDIKDYKNHAKKIQKLLNDKDKRKAFAEKSYQIFIDNFKSEIATKKMIQIYKEVARKGV
jgi:glycosyltransferase involved in cell wall biosynthesis